ncbi:uncharacterized protein LOC112505488, partial [Cynara cardunculus var. scolymus]|uniref:uncharacterized protein LOC112505488 n=1 Tax=Cynara cardunculus var. scolymus TaxID=59895 RepID=UPI000D6279CB
MDLTHLCFADDLFVFTKGDVQSVEILKKALFLFQQHSGLEPSLEKCEVYFGNVSPNIKEAILECLPFILGLFPICYLGVPLSHARLKISDYGPLIANVKSRILNWKSKFLSFGGRRQLIISVLQFIQLHWMSVFLFPSGITHDLESIFRKFLWAPREDPRGRCRLSWDMVCRPLESGGLGIRRVATWNRALLAKYIWDIVRHRGSLWVCWIYCQNLRSSHFWTVRKNSTWSWVFRNLLDLRVQLRRFLFSQIGDGRNTNAWEDNWLNCGHLSAFISYRFIHSCVFSTTTTVHELLMSLNGVWPNDWCNRFAELGSSPLPLLNISVHDKVLWWENCLSSSDFSVSTAWAMLEGNHPVVPWYKLVWFSGHIPKHAFCLWLACQRVFLLRIVWDSILHIVGLVDMPSLWDQIVDIFSDSNRRSKLLNRKLAVAASVFIIFGRRFGNAWPHEWIQWFPQLQHIVIPSPSPLEDTVRWLEPNQNRQPFE